MLARILGMKSSQGTLDNGTAYDSCKVYVLTRFAESDNQKGFAVAEYKIGNAAEFGKYKHLQFPFDAEMETEQVTNGKTTATVIVSLVPKAQVKA